MILIAATFFLVMSIYSTWYLLDCLYADRKDRSILFWKSTADLRHHHGALQVAGRHDRHPAGVFCAADVTTLMMAFVISVRASLTSAARCGSGDLWLQIQVCGCMSS